MYLKMYTRYILKPGIDALFCYWTEGKLLFWYNNAYHFHVKSDIISEAIPVD